jgi:hypothetical protein
MILWVGLVACLPGCGGPAAGGPWASTPHAALLFDATGGATQRNHFELVADPFGGRDMVGRGTWGAHGGQKMVLLNDAGFFPMPANADAWSVMIRLALQGQRDLRFVLVGAGGRGVGYRRSVPAEGKWCNVALPLSEAAGRIRRGVNVVDITVMQSDPSERAVLYVHSAVLARRASP